MEYIDIELEYVRSLNSEFEAIIDSCVEELKDSIRHVIKKRWKSGVSVNGGAIVDKGSGEGYSSLSYKVSKILKNPGAGGRVDLTLTGALGDGIDVVKDGNRGYKIISTDKKYNDIGSKYGFEEFGLSQEELSYFMDLLRVLIEHKLKV